MTMPAMVSKLLTRGRSEEPSPTPTAAELTTAPTSPIANTGAATIAGIATVAAGGPAETPFRNSIGAISELRRVDSDDIFTESDSMDKKTPMEERTPIDEEHMSLDDKDRLEDIIPAGEHITSHQLPRNAGFLKAFSNVVCIIIGTGCLQIPYAFAKTGWIGVAIIVLSAFIGGYTGKLTIKCLYCKPGERLHSFPQIGRAAFGKYGQYATQFFNYLYSLGTTCLYIILAGQFVDQLISTVGVHISKKVWMIIVAIIMWVPVAILKEFSEAAILAIFGLLASIVVIFVATIMSFLYPYTKMHPADPVPGHDIAIAVGLPIALSSIVFSFAGSVVYPHVEGSMKKPKQWCSVLYSAMIFCAIAYLVIGISGYWAYGNKVVSPVLDSIPTGPPATVAKIMITIHVIIAAPIMLLSFYLEVENQWNITAENLGKKKEFTIRLIYRSVVVAIICAVSLAIPYFSDFLSLISSIACVTMFAIIPIVCYLKLFGFKVAPWYEKIWMAVVLAIGMVACIWGSVDAIKSLINDTKHH